MTRLDVADLVVIAARTLGTSTEAVLAQMDVVAAKDALAEARWAAQAPGRALGNAVAAAAAGVVLVRALLRHRPFPGHGQQVTVAAGLQFLSLNGWQADLNPASTAAVVVEALGTGQLTPEAVTAWLSPPLTRVRRLTTILVPRPSLGPWRSLPVVRVPADCMRSHGKEDFPYPSAGGVAIIAPAAGIILASPQFRAAETTCHQITPAATVRIVDAGTAVGR